MKLTVAITTALFAIMIGTLLADPSHHGWPNHGIAAPGQPNHPNQYASPGKPEHP